MDIYDFLGMIGGLALFLFGMQVLGDGLEKQAGGKFKGILGKLTSNPFKGLLLGAGVTAVIQSSSATTVMVVGFVNSGIMSLRQAVGIIMGANIGTTVTAWILSLTGLQGDSFLVTILKPATFAPIVAIIGVFMLMVANDPRKRDIGTILTGFAVLMIGMDLMSDAVAPLADMPEFVNLLTLFSNPVLGILTGMIVTAVIQSSSASIGILQALAISGSVNFGTAIPIILGQNIGTCVTSLISSIGTNKNARRAAIVHLIFNLIGTTIVVAGFYGLNAVFEFSFLNLPINAFWIAVIHTAFNIIITLILFPFAGQLVKLSEIIVKDGKEEEEFDPLDKRLFATPSIAVAQCVKVTNQMLDVAKSAAKESLSIIEKYDEKKIAKIKKAEKKLDKYEDKIGTYLVELTELNLSVSDSQTTSKMMYCINEFEQLGDEAVNICQSVEELHVKELTFSENARSQIKTTANAVDEILDLTAKAFKENDVDLARDVEPLETVVDYLKRELKARHVKRVQAGKCTIEQGFVFSELISSLEHMADYCSSIAASIIQLDQNNLETHEYLDSVKDKSNEEFKQKYRSYKKKYAV